MIVISSYLHHRHEGTSYKQYITYIQCLFCIGEGSHEIPYVHQTPDNRQWNMKRERDICKVKSLCSQNLNIHAFLSSLNKTFKRFQSVYSSTNLWLQRQNFTKIVPFPNLIIFKVSLILASSKPVFHGDDDERGSFYLVL